MGPTFLAFLGNRTRLPSDFSIATCKARQQQSNIFKKVQESKNKKYYTDLSCPRIMPIGNNYECVRTQRILYIYTLLEKYRRAGVSKLWSMAKSNTCLHKQKFIKTQPCSHVSVLSMTTVMLQWQLYNCCKSYLAQKIQTLILWSSTEKLGQLPTGLQNKLHYTKRRLESSGKRTEGKHFI